MDNTEHSQNFRRMYRSSDIADCIYDLINLVIRGDSDEQTRTAKRRLDDLLEGLRDDAIEMANE
jgi:hypothetical protein